MKRIIPVLLRAVLVCFALVAANLHFCMGQSLNTIPFVPFRKTDSLQRVIKQASDPTQRVIALLQLGTMYYHAPYPKGPHLQQAMQLATQAKVLSAGSQLPELYQDALLLTGHIYLRQGQIQAALSILPQVNDTTRFKLLLGLCLAYRNDPLAKPAVRKANVVEMAAKARAIGRQLKDSVRCILADQQLVFMQADLQEPGAEAALLQIADRFKRQHYPLLHYTYYELATLTYNQSSDDKALHYSLATLKSMNATQDTLGKPDFLANHAGVLRKIGQHDSSLFYLQQTIDRLKYQYAGINMATAARFVCEERVKLGQMNGLESAISQLYRQYPPTDTPDRLAWLSALGNMHRQLKQYGKAEAYFKERIALQSMLGMDPGYYGLGQLYTEAGQYVKAKPYLYKALENTNSGTSIRQLAHLHYLLFLADSASGDYIAAIRHLSKNKRYDDTLMQQSKVEAIQKYSIEFESERKEISLREKDREIALLSTEKKLKEMYAQRLRFIQVTSIVGVAIVIIAGFLFYRQYQRKKKDRDTIAQMNAALQQSLVEKEWLLKEVHHRVKNNLHTIICLLESQAMYLEKDALQAIEKSQHRIYAMSLIHQKLYQHEDTRSIDLSLYLQEFIGYLIDSFDARHIEFRINVDPIQLPLQQAVPVALIINEAVTNSIKHAFDGSTDPIVSISMRKEDQQIVLCIADNGKGLSALHTEEGKSLGMQLIRGLSKELKGTLVISAHRGTQLVIQFTPQPIGSTSPHSTMELS